MSEACECSEFDVLDLPAATPVTQIVYQYTLHVIFAFAFDLFLHPLILALPHCLFQPPPHPSILLFLPPFLHPPAKPQNRASVVTAVESAKPVVVARCESADGRPAAKIVWVTTANGNATTVSKAGADNTVTVSSEYRMVPTAADNGRDISCVVEHRTQVTPQSFKMQLAVQCKFLHLYFHFTCICVIQ